jgi:hypothetical protein
MPEAEDQDELFEAALERIKERVAARTVDGTYPVGLDDELDAHFDRLASLGRLDDIDAVNAAVARVRAAPRPSLERIPSTSRFPGGHAAHRAVQTVVSRQLNGLIEQLDETRTAVAAALERIVAFVEPIGPTSGVEITARLAGMADRVSRVDQALVAIRDLERRVGELEARLAEPPA